MRRREYPRATRPPRRVLTKLQQAEIVRRGETLLQFGPLSATNRLTPLPERLDAKAELLRAVASAWFKEEAMTLEQIRTHLEVDERRFLAGIRKVRPARSPYGPFDSITGVFALSSRTAHNFIKDNDQYRDQDWDDLDVVNDFAPAGSPCNPCVGVNVVVSLPYICGSKTLTLDVAMVALLQHIRLVAGPVNLFGSRPDGPTPHFLTTVTEKEETYYWAQELGMEFVMTTDHNWTKAVAMQTSSGKLSFAEQWARRVCRAIDEADEVIFY